ncbi:MAG: hypothetical protein K6A80_07190 [Saccharofermentans sp.]|nr:hypothetical protein [Saccharofermentans sp.]
MSLQAAAKDKRLKITVIAILCLIVLYLLMLTVVPEMSIWSIPKAFNNGDVKVAVSTENTYEQSFEMPFVRICSIDIPMDTNKSDNVVAVNATATLLDSSGNVVAEKKITSAYDTVNEFKYISVNRGETYRLKLMVNSVGTGSENERVPLLTTDENGALSFTVKGIVGDSSEVMVFTIVYLICSVAVMLFIMRIDVEHIGKIYACDGVIFGLLILLSIVLITQYYDLFMIAKSALRMVDAFKSGNVLNYMDSSYTSELADQSSKMLFAYEYNFISIFIVAVLMAPLMFFYNGDLAYSDGGVVVMYLTVVVCVMVFVAAWLIKYITKECAMGESYLRNVRLLFLSSAMLLYMSVAYGQIDIIYIAIILAALPFYYRKKYYIFALIMSVVVAMKTLPLMIFIPLLLLAVKKVREIVINMAIVMVFPVLTKLLFERNYGHTAVANVIDEDYTYIDRITSFRIGDSISIFVLLFALICIAAFFHKADVDNKKEMLFKSMLAIFITYSCFASFVDWHQQWLIPLVLSAAFLIPFYENNKLMLLLNTAIEGLFILTTNAQGVSTYMINYGIIPPLLRQGYSGTSVKLILNTLSPIAIPAVRTLFAATLLFMAIYLVRKRPAAFETHECSRVRAFGRLGLLYGFILFYSWCYSFIG